MSDDALTKAYFAVCKKYNSDIAAEVVIVMKTRQATITETPERYALWVARRRWINSRRRERREIPFSHLPVEQQKHIEGRLYGDGGYAIE